MAPKRKPKKNRNTRMDGAIEAMTKEYGFSDEQFVRKVAKELLQEYGGEDGWYFIEQYSYKELLEALLRYQSETEEEKPNKRDDLPKVLNDQDNPAKGEDLIENGSIEQKAKEHATTDVADPSYVLAEATFSEVVNNGLEISNQDDKKCLPPVDKDGESWKDIGLDHPSSQREKADTSCDENEKFNSHEDGDKSSILVPTTPMGDTPVPSPLPTISTPPPPPSRFPSKRHKPCYGWIETDEEDGGDVFIELTPAVEWEDLKLAKRRSGWDLRPEDP